MVKRQLLRARRSALSTTWTGPTWARGSSAVVWRIAAAYELGCLARATFGQAGGVGRTSSLGAPAGLLSLSSAGYDSAVRVTVGQEG